MKMICSVLFAALLSLPPAGHAESDPLVGEWSLEPGGCAESRMAFDFEGLYDLRVAEDGRWKSLYGGRWTRDGDTLVFETDGERERFGVESASAERMVLVSRDGPVDRELGVGVLDLTRCFAP
tara:strand:+ start:179 stop:547 length:369 start_codon:yes stop_codon:yes gene_type:complete